MPRPIRIEYPNAFYHVMNRGRGRCDIFHSNKYYQSFLKIIKEAHIKFGLVVHAYCLMSNHYHLLVETPNANLGRIMRHINGIYTQKYNQLKKTDGPLFRGRYKAILIEENKYLQDLSRYIHRNPIDTKVKMVSNIRDYKWSSYRCYLNLIKEKPLWLNIEKTLKMFVDNDDLLKNYEIFVTCQDVDDSIIQLYQKRNIPAVLGGKNFKEKILYEKLADNTEKQKRLLDQINKNKELTIEQIIDFVSEICAVDKNSITSRNNGGQNQNIPRALTMFLCQEYKDLTLKEIASIFGLKNKGSASKAIFRIKNIINNGGLNHELGLIKDRLWLTF
jgi:putative transposase